MARVVDFAKDDVPASERRFLNEAKRQLPGDWTVYHSLRIRRQTRIRDQPRDHEADFLILDPARGALVIEVKGGRIERQGADWFSTDRHGKRHRLKKDPMKQASDTMYELVKKLDSAPALRHRRRPRLESAVAFPDVARPSHELGVDLEADAVLFADDLRDMQSALDRVFDHYLMTETRRMSSTDIEALKREIEPHWAANATIAVRIERNREAIRNLTDEQERVLRLIERQRRVAIEGAAGTGKTVLAELKAKRLAEEGQRVLLLCFNSALAEWLSSRAVGFEAKSFHAFCRERALAAGLPFDVPQAPTEQSDFWKETAPILLLEALETQPDARYDAIIVDEGQDFQHAWWEAVECALNDEQSGILYAFFDPNQDIYGGGPPDELDRSLVSLIWNCRNTRRIASYATQLIDTSCEFLPDAPRGEPVKSLSYETPEEMSDKVRRQLHHLVNEDRVSADQITVLSTHSTKRSHLASQRRLGNFELVEHCRHPNHIRFTSLHKFKGLESDIVILVDVDGNPRSCTPRHRYVAATRARTLLIVLEEARAAA